MTQKRKCVDLTGRKFGYWTVLEAVPREAQRAFGYNMNHVYWYCKCKCGEISMIPSNNLLSGRSHGCRSCSARGRGNGGNPWKAEEERRRQDERR